MPTSVVAAVDSNCKKRQKNFLIHGELKDANKAPCFSSEREVIFDVFFSLIDAEAYKKN